VAECCAVDVVSSDLLQERRRRERDRTPNVRQPAMGRDERQARRRILSQYAEDTNRDPVLEILFPQVFGNLAILAQCADVELLA
jgi:hypothetical protein